MQKLVIFFMAANCCLAVSNKIGVRLLFGMTDATETKWDGAASATGAKISTIEPWRFEGDDALVTGHSWKLATHRAQLFGGGQSGRRPFVPNGIMIFLDDAREDAALQIRTGQGNFTIALTDIPYGKTWYGVAGRVAADRIPFASRITNSRDEEDYPAAAAGKDGGVWLAYLTFRHSPEHDRLRAGFRQPPSDFGAFSTPAGGDQILARRYAEGAWSEPVALTPPGLDLYRPAVAVDGSGRPWVFWPQSEQGSFHLWARSMENGKPGRAIRLTTEAGTDLDPVAATDARGRVWLAWQGWRKGHAAIWVCRQAGSGFSKPLAISFGIGNDWNPAIAPAADGRVTIAWDTYRGGNYDIYARTVDGAGRWSGETALVRTSRYEAYPSIAYDHSGRLWLAYEEGAERWGKDFGAYDSTGIALYQGRAVRLLGFARNGEMVTTTADIGSALPGASSYATDAAARQRDLEGWEKPNPDVVKTRRPNQHICNSLPNDCAIPSPKNSLPRLAIDTSDRIWIASRSEHPFWWNANPGTVWTEYLACYDGREWLGPLFLSHSDNLLDNRPALVSTGGGGMLVIGSSDARREFHPVPRQSADVIPDPYNNDLYANLVELPQPAGPIKTRLVDAAVSAPDPAAAAERAAIDRLRNFRLNVRGRQLRVLRGEFHRHSEISSDGGMDGSLLDQWRYVLDTAALDWVGCCDHDNGNSREYSWWIIQKQTDMFYTPGRFVPMFSYERSVRYPEGHRNVLFVQRGVRPLPRLPLSSPDAAGPAPDTQMLYAYLRHFHGIAASHSSGTNMGTDWRDNDPDLEPAVEIYQGDRQNYEMPGAPRSNSEHDSIGGWRPKGFVSLALQKGFQLGFEASSDHVSTHMSYSNVYAAGADREAVLDAFRRRHVYGSTDNILAGFRSGDYIMGDSFRTSSLPEMEIKLVGTAPFANVHIVRDNKYVYSAEPHQSAVTFTWKDTSPNPGVASYYYVRGEQQNGEIVWVSPMWITYTGH